MSTTYGTARRLAKVAAALTPTQAMLGYLDEIAASASVLDHARAQVGEPESAAPLARLVRQVEHGARTRHHGATKEGIERAEIIAVRDVAFLYFLFLHLNERLLGERRLRAFQLIVIGHELRTRMVALDDGAARNWVMQERVQPLVVELKAIARVVTLVNARYFAGRELRFPDLAAAQDAELQTLDELMTSYVALVELTQPRSGGPRQRDVPEPRGYAQFDAATLEPAVASMAEELAIGLVDLAKADALLFIGERGQAWSLLERHL